MDTNRIEIIYNDLGKTSTAGESAVVGYTVVKAEKGPIEPFFIPAASPSLIQEYVGYTSAEYPTVQELIDFNSEYGVYVSAPYNVAGANRVPVAYMTPAGIFARKDTVLITGNRIEDVIADSVLIDGISSFDGDEEVLVPVGRNKTLFNAGDDVATPLTYTSGATKSLSIALGANISPVTGELLNAAESDLHFLNPAAWNASEPGRVLRQAAPGTNAVLVVDIPGTSAPIELYLTVSTGSILVTDTAGNLISTLLPDADSEITTVVIDSAQVRGSLTGLYATYFSQTAIATTWASEDFRNSVKIYWKATVNRDSIAATIYPKYLSSRTTTLTFARGAYGNRTSFTAIEKSSPTAYSSRTLTGSIKDDDVDGFGASLSFRDKIEGQGIISVVTIQPFDNETVYTATKTTVGPTLTMPPIVLSRGVRDLTGDIYSAGWAEASDPELDDVEVFFNPVPLIGNETNFLGLATSHPLSRFIAARIVPAGDPTISEDMAQLSFGKNYFITNNLSVRTSSYTKENFSSPLVGAYALMICRILEDKDGGAAPMFVNEGRIGGQLPVTVKKMLYKYSKEELDYLDAANYNTIIKDPSYGVMVVSQKTAKGGESSDWSYIGHASAFLKFVREIRKNVMLPQIGKPNNYEYQTLRANQVQTYINSRVSGPGRIWAAAVVDTVNVNTEEIKAQRKFAIAVTVKVDIFSEGVVLTLTNVDQFTTIG